MTDVTCARSELRIDVDPDHSPPSPACVVVDGEIDIDSAADLHTALGRLSRDGCHEVIVDMARVRFCDASGVSVLLRNRRHFEQAGGTFCVVAPSPAVSRLIRIFGLDDVLGPAR